MSHFFLKKIHTKDVGGRFLVADGSVISVLWSRDIRLISEKHFKKEMDKEKMFVVLFCNANYKPCVNTIAGIFFLLVFFQYISRTSFPKNV